MKSTLQHIYLSQFKVNLLSLVNYCVEEGWFLVSKQLRKKDGSNVLSRIIKALPAKAMLQKDSLGKEWIITIDSCSR